MKKYQIFVSSTYTDLVEERAQVTNAILEMNHIPVGMEMFSASDESQWKLIQRIIDDCDYYVVVLAHKYGSRDTDGKSFTEKEYDYAVSKGIPTLGFVIKDGSMWSSDKMDMDEDLKSLNLFKEKVKSKMVKFWTDKFSLHAAVVTSLSKYFTLEPGIGWIKANEATDPKVLNEVSRLSSENAELRKQLDSFTANVSLEDKATEVLSLLNHVTKGIGFKYKGSTSYEKHHNCLYSDIFYSLSPELLTRNSLERCSLVMAYALRPDKDRTPNTNFPIARNVTRSTLASLVALDLLIISDTDDDGEGTKYYKLSELGILVYKKMIHQIMGKTT